MRLGALGADGRITAHGREMARLSVHPRLAHMLLRARPLSLVRARRRACSPPVGARPAARRRAAKDADIRTRLEVLRGEGAASTVDRGHSAPGAPVRARTRAAGRRRAWRGGGAGADSVAGILMAFAYPDRIGRRRPGAEGRYTLANGRGAHFAESQALARQEFIVAVDLDDRDRDARILVAAALSRADLVEHFARPAGARASRSSGMRARRRSSRGAPSPSAVSSSMRSRLRQFRPSRPAQAMLRGRA